MVFVSAYMGGCHGTAKSARDFLRALMAALPEVHVVSPTREDFPELICGRSASRPQWITIPDGRKPLRYLTPLTGCRDRIYRAADRRRIPAGVRRDTVIVNGWASVGYWNLIADLFSGRRFLIVRESPRHFSGADRDTDLSELLRGLARFDGFIFVSDCARREWLSFPELAGKEHYYLPNCCEEEEVTAMLARDRDAVRRELGFAADDYLVLCPGTLEHRKGQDLLVGALGELARQIPHLRAVFVGNAGTAWGERVLREITEGETSPCCRYLPERPQILDLLYAADVLAFPSRAEGMPRTVLEAMALATPVVASAVDGTVEIVESGSTGLLVPVDDRQGLLQALLAVAREPGVGRAMARQAQERYWSLFSRERQLARVQEILQQMTRNRR